MQHLAFLSESAISLKTSQHVENLWIFCQVTDRFAVHGLDCHCYEKPRASRACGRTCTWGFGGGEESETEYVIGWTSYQIKLGKKAQVKRDEPIHRRVLTKSECVRHLSVKDEDGNECPLKIGFDVVVTPEIGVSLYVLLNAYLQVPVTVEFYGILPEKNPKYIGEPEGVAYDLCAAKHWKASTWFEIGIEVNLGARLEIEFLRKAITLLLKKDEKGLGEIKLDKAVTR